MNTVEHLQKIRALIAKGFTQGTCARNSDGEPVPATSPGAVCWCLMGAALRVCREETGEPLANEHYDVWALFERATLPYSSPVVFNDRASQTGMLAMIDGVIKQEEENARAIRELESTP